MICNSLLSFLSVCLPACLLAYLFVYIVCLSVCLSVIKSYMYAENIKERKPYKNLNAADFTLWNRYRSYECYRCYGKSFFRITLNKVMFKIFDALHKDTCGDICKYFDVDPIEELRLFVRVNLS